MLKCFTSVAIVATATAVMTVQAAPSQAAQMFTVNGADYELETITGSFLEFQDRLESEPWWGSADIAEDFAEVVEEDLGLSSFTGPVFVHNTSLSIIGRIWASEDFVLGEGVYQRSAPATSTQIFAVTTQATPVPTPALLPGLIGFGMSIVRKKRKQEAAA